MTKDNFTNHLTKENEELGNLFNEITEIISKIEKGQIHAKQLNLILDKAKMCYIKLNVNVEAVDDAFNLLIQKSWPFFKNKNNLGNQLAVILNHLITSGKSNNPKFKEAFLLLRAFSRLNEINHNQYYDLVNVQVLKPEARTLQRDKEWKLILDKQWNLSSKDVSNILDYNDPKKRWVNKRELRTANDSWTVYSLLKVCEKVLLHLEEASYDPASKAAVLCIKKMMAGLNNAQKTNAERLIDFYREKSKLNQGKKPCSYLQRSLKAIEETLDAISNGLFSRLIKKDVWHDSKLVGFFRAAEKIKEDAANKDRAIYSSSIFLPPK